MLETIRSKDIADRLCSELRSADYIQFARSLDVQPQTVGNYMSHLGEIVRIARPDWVYPLGESELDDAMVVGKRLGLTGKSVARERRQTPNDLNRILDYYTDMAKRERAELPMRELIVFALFSTRRQEEITTIRARISRAIGCLCET